MKFNVGARGQLTNVSISDDRVVFQFKYSHPMFEQNTIAFRVIIENTTIVDIIGAIANRRPMSRTHIVQIQYAHTRSAETYDMCCDLVERDHQKFLVLYTASDFDQSVQIELTDDMIDRLTEWTIRNVEPDQFSLDVEDDKLFVYLWNRAYDGNLTDSHKCYLIAANTKRDYGWINNTVFNPIEGSYIDEGEMFNIRMSFDYCDRSKTVQIKIQCDDYTIPFELIHEVPVDTFASDLEHVVEYIDIDGLEQ